MTSPRPRTVRLHLKPGERILVTFEDPREDDYEIQDTVVIKYHDGPHHLIEINHEPTQESCNLTYFAKPTPV